MPATIAEACLDHVAVAVERWSDAWPRYAVELGGRWASGGLNAGFGPAQLRYANEARLEVLQPWQPEANPFLRRFLDRHGPGAHHLTFKVPDLAAALATVRAEGFSPVGVEVSDPHWKEAFLHPHQAAGIVVQLAQAAGGSWESPAPEGFPRGRQPAASLVRITHAVSHLDRGLALFCMLDGRIETRATAPDGTWEYADMVWPQPPTLRLVAPTPEGAGGTLDRWVGRRSGRLHHLAFSVPAHNAAPVNKPRATGGSGPAHGRGSAVATGGVPGVLDTSDRVVVEPDDNLGVRLVITCAPPAAQPATQ